MSELKCPFCGEKIMYEIQREDELGTVIPQLFCNCCKMIFEVENDSPYLSDEKTFVYLKEKLLKIFNTRKPMERIAEQLELKSKLYSLSDRDCEFAIPQNIAIEIVKEEGGLNE